MLKLFDLVIFFKKWIRQTLFLYGAKEMSKYIISTFGPHGRTVAFSNKVETITTKDGFNVSQFYFSKNPLITAGAHLLRQGCKTTLAEVGDGTTATAIIASSFLGKKLSNLEIKQIDREVENIIDVISRSAKKASPSDIKKVAMISSNFDETIATSVANAVNSLSPSASYIIEEGSEKGIKTIFKTGFTFNSGFIDPVFINNQNGSCILNTPKIIIMHDDYTIPDVIDEINSCIAKKQNLVIIGFPDENAKDVIIKNYVKGTLSCCLITPPFFGKTRDDFLCDLSEILKTGDKIKKIIVNKYSSIITHDCDLSDYISKLKNMEVKSNAEKDDIKNRIARLLGEICVFKIGEDNQAALFERKDRLEDTVRAVNVARLSGVVSGAHACLFNLANCVNNKHLKEAMMKPRKILLKAALSEGFKNDVIDPAGVIISVLKNGWGVGKQFLTTNDIIVNLQ